MLLHQLHRFGCILTIAATCLAGEIAQAQVLPENFEDLGGICGEGPCRLINEGWIFRDQGTYWQGPAWEPPYVTNEFIAHSGVSFMKSQKGSVFGGPLDGDGSVNTWAILPPLEAEAGDIVTFFVRGRVGVNGVFEVRYSPSGSINSGSGGFGVGDFTEVLLQMAELPWAAWQAVSFMVPGDGRIALRNHSPHEAFFNDPVVIAVDTMSLNAAPSGPPIPQPGEEVTWTQAMSPVELNTSLFIPAGGTVIIEPGVQVNIAPQTTISIAGKVIGNGTAENAIAISASSNFPPAFLVSGELDLTHASINAQVRPEPNGSLLFSHCTFAGPYALLFNTSLLVIEPGIHPPFISLDHCTFDASEGFYTGAGHLRPSDATLRVTNSTFINGASALPLRGYVYLDELQFDGGSLSVGRDHQPVYLDNISVSNAPGAALNLGGGNVGNDYFLGPNLTLSNNGYPAASIWGGILPGSVLPAQGNAVNAVLVESSQFEIRGPLNWGNAGIPYHVPNAPVLIGEVNVLPGVTMRFAQGAGFSETDNFQARGLPDAPIVFEPLQTQWCCIFTPYRLEYTVVDGSFWGIVNPAIGLQRYFDSCIFRNNERGMVGSAIVRSTQFLNNNVGADISFPTDLNGQSNPNSFVGNGLAVKNANGAAYNWWGDPTGPTGPQNPGGTGDPVAGHVPVAPHLVAAPDYTNHPPVIRLEKVYFAAQGGSTIILNWTAVDDDLVSQRVLLSTAFDTPSNYVLIAELPASQRAYALTVPSQGSVPNNVFHIRVEGIDELGQVGWDHAVSSVRSITFDPDLVPGDSFLVGEGVPQSDDVSFQETGFILLDGQMRSPSYGAGGVIPPQIMASTDSVRLGLRDQNGNFRFSSYLTVRPDERLGDEPPVVTLNAPLSGSFAGGSVVPISWSASDDEGIRSAAIQGSYDGGLTWHDIVRDLPGNATGYDWQLPPLEQTIADVRVRVVAFDLRFQTSSATSGVVSLTPGDGGDPGPLGDLNADGVVGVADLLILLSAWGNCPLSAPCPADLNGDGIVGVADLLLLLSNWG